MFIRTGYHERTHNRDIITLKLFDVKKLPKSRGSLFMLHL